MHHYVTGDSMPRFFFFLLFGWLAVIAACQVPTLPSTLQPCQNAKDCGGLACVQGLCTASLVETTAQEPSLERAKEDGVEPSTESLVENAELFKESAEAQLPEPTEPSAEFTQEERLPESTEPNVEPSTEPLPEALEASVEKEPTQEPEPTKENEPVQEKPTETCVDGSKRSCSSGSFPSAPKGECKLGEQVCQGGVWGNCNGEVLPQTESCNGKDDDCDGKTDEQINCTCIDGSQQDCGINVGACKKGIQECKNGAWGACMGNITPTTEICDNIDNNCDGQIDNVLNLGKPCTTTYPGICNGGIFHCDLSTRSLICKPNLLPNARAETCNNLDDNCDGQIDGFTRPCGISAGQCMQGTQACNAGVWGACTGGVTPQTETCDGQDNDCDGKTDEGNPGGGAVCYNNPSAGKLCNGVVTCINGTLSCQNAITPEVCNLRDDNCDGTVDNIPQVLCSQYTYTTRSTRVICVTAYSKCNAIGQKECAFAPGQSNPIPCNTVSDCTKCPSYGAIPVACKNVNGTLMCTYL